jgi:hypothetical protein
LRCFDGLEWTEQGETVELDERDHEHWGMSDEAE